MPGSDNLSIDQLRLIYDNTHDLIFLIGVDEVGDFHVLSVNQSYLDHTQLTADKIVGKPIRKTLSPEQHDYVYNQYSTAIDSRGPYTYETRTRMRGRDIYLHTTIVPVFDDNGECIYLIGVSRDITTNKLERKLLEQERDRAENYLNIAEALIVGLDKDANITSLNRKGYQILGYPEGSLTGKNWCELCIEPGKHDLFWQNWGQTTTNTLVSRNVNYICARDGSRILMSSANSVILDDNGEFAGILSSAEDITDRRRAEKAMIASQRQLAAGEVAAAVAHDFNNSLQGILGNIELALASTGLPEDVRERLKTATDLAGDAANRIKVLQRYAGADAKTAQDDIDINRLVEDVIGQTQHLWKDDAQRRGSAITILREFDDELTASLGSMSELRSALYNVMKNSIEAITGEGAITLTTRRHGVDNIIRVNDTGAGMNDEAAARLFQPFFSTKGLETGRGLGMSATLSIIRGHKGEITLVESTPGVGTTIEIRLPAAETRAAIAEAAQQDPIVNHHIILWVDDDAAVRSLATNYISALGHEGDVAESGAQAIEMLSKKRYSVVITDIGMAGMNGFELAERIEQDPDLGIPVIALTGWGEDVLEPGQEAPGITSLLAKPIRLADLKQTLDDVATG